MTADVLIVGGGPAGASAAAALASSGQRVVLVEQRRSQPTAGSGNVCGGLVTPRAVVALANAGIDLDTIAGAHRVTHVRITTEHRNSSTRWPSHETFPPHGFVVARSTLDPLLLDRARAAGAEVLTGHTATEPIVERGFVRGATVVGPDGATRQLRSSYVIVADGANSRFGRFLGTYREPTWPSALAHRAVFRSQLHDAAEVEFVLDLRDRAGGLITGFGWMFPRGDGTVNVGVLMWSTSPSFRVVNPAHLLEQFVADQRPRWRLVGPPVQQPAGGRIPLGASVGPAAGPTYLVVGDAAGVANPLSGAGIEYAVESGTLAASVLAEAIRGGSSAALQRYPALLADRYGAYFKVGRLVDRFMGRPAIARQVGLLAASRPAFATSMVRVAGNELRSRHPGAIEFAYRMGRAASMFAPDA